MTIDHSSLINQLAAGLTPVRRLRRRDGALLTAMAFAATVLLVWLVSGIWASGVRGRADPVFYITNLLLLVLGISAVVSVLRMATPGVGNRYDGTRWSLAMLAVLPAVALAYLLGADDFGRLLADRYGVECMLKGTAFAGLTGGVLVWWLRRGAPAVPHAAGFLTGVAAGALGSAAYGLSCPIDGLHHVAIWHVLPVVVLGIVGRFGLPYVLRW